MGCGISYDPDKKLAQIKLLNKEPDNIVSESATPLNKVRMYNAIKCDQEKEVVELLEKVHPQENLRIKGEYFTCLHTCAISNAQKSVKVLFEWLQKNNKENIFRIFNIQDNLMRTPAMIAAKNDSVEAFQAMVDTDLVDYQVRDYDKKTVEDLCSKYSLRSYDYVFQFRNKQNLLEDEKQKLLEEEQRRKFEEEKRKREEEQHRIEMEELEQKKQQLQEAEAQQKLEEEIKRKKEEERRRKEIERQRQQQEEERKAKLLEEMRRKEQEAKLMEQEEAKHEFLKGINPRTKAYKLLKENYEKNSYFVDPEFPPSVKSISRNPNHQYIKDFKEAVWKRPDQLLNCDFKRVNLFDGIDPNDISQGVLGVCYFLVALSATAEFPARLLKCFITKEANSYGVYSMQFYIRGIPTEIVVDDQTPCWKSSRRPLFTKPKGRELWVILLEKAFCKTYGSYTISEGGFPEEAMETLHGCPAIRHRTQDEDLDTIWNFVQDADKNNFLMACGTRGNVEESTGLHGGHAYTIISTHLVKGYKLLKVRNPWGHGEWKGKFSDKSSAWTPQMKKEVNFVDEDDGCFFMELKDFQQCFGHYDIAFYHDDFKYSYIEDTNDPHHSKYYRFFVSEPTEAYFRIHQEDKRLHMADIEDVYDTTDGYEYSPASFLICRIHDGDLLEHCANDPDKDVDTTQIFGGRTIFISEKKKVKLQKGEYLIRVKVDWYHKKPDKFVLSTYASTKLSLEAVEFKNFWEKYSLYQGIQSKEKKAEKFDCMSYSKTIGNIVLFYYQNNGNRQWEVDIQFEKLQNYKIAKYHKKSEKNIKIIIPPGTKQVGVLKQINVREGASISRSTKYSYI